MGHKTDPRILRIGIIYGWNGKWFAKGKEYIAALRQDILLNQYLREQLKDAGLAKIEIQRTPQSLTLVLTVSRPGVIIGKGGVGAEKLREEIRKRFFPKTNLSFNLNIIEIKNPNLSAAIVMRDIISDVEKRMPYRRIMKHAMDRVMKAGAKGVKVTLAGRLGGVEIARRETLHTGRFPLHTLRADIDYIQGTAFTLYGTIGVKVWIYKGEIFAKEQSKS